MNRVIKFELIVDGKIVGYESYIPNLNCGVWYYVLYDDPERLLQCKLFWPQKTPLGKIERRQYTGLLDKNGKEGYHKDICTDGTNLYLIEWIATDAKFVLFQASEGILINDNVRRMRFLDEMEIIGDVYENPELVEQ